MRSHSWIVLGLLAMPAFAQEPPPGIAGRDGHKEFQWVCLRDKCTKTPGSPEEWACQWSNTSTGNCRCAMPTVQANLEASLARLMLTRPAFGKYYGFGCGTDDAAQEKLAQAVAARYQVR